MKQAFFDAKYHIRGTMDRSLVTLLDQIKTSSYQDADMYGSGPLLEEFEQQLAKDLGFDAACFFPSGTMAQQIALRIWSDKKGNSTVAYHPLCHLEIHEQDGLKKLHHLSPILLGEKNRLFTLTDLKCVTKQIGTLLIELPQREIGGVLPTLTELKEIASYCKENNIMLHLDGARLFETLPYYGVDIQEITTLFDSVYISFYKGLAGIAGAMLLGPKSFVVEAKIWKRRHGGDLISLFPYILSAKHVYETRVKQMETYYKHAIDLAEEFNKIEGVTTKPTLPVSNMFHVYFDKTDKEMQDILKAVMLESNVGITPYINPALESKSMFELSVGENILQIPNDILRRTFDLLKEKMMS